MSTELIINASLPETRIALMEDGEIQELLIERASGKGIVGNIYKGRVTRVLPGMQAAFVDIGLEKAAFLYVDDVFVHSEIWEEEEGPDLSAAGSESTEASATPREAEAAPSAGIVPVESVPESESSQESELEPDVEDDMESHLHDADFDDDSDESEESGGDEPTEMGRDPSGEDDVGNRSDTPAGTIAPESQEPSESKQDRAAASAAERSEGSDAPEADGQGAAEGAAEAGADAGGEAAGGRKRFRRGRRGGRNRKRGDREPLASRGKGERSASAEGSASDAPVYDEGASADEEHSDRSAMSEEGLSGGAPIEGSIEDSNRPEGSVAQEGSGPTLIQPVGSGRVRPEFREQRSRDRRIKPKAATRSIRGQAKIEDLLKEGQEVLVQVAKDPISSKGARLTCHISLPGRHLVCMPTIDHVGVSRRIERDDERRKLREFVERYRPKNLGFIVRTASGKNQAEKRIQQDIQYLTRLWTEIREKASAVTAPALVYEDLNSVLRSIRDWVSEEIDKIVVDSRYHFNDIQRFVTHFMPSLKQKVELYQGDIPIFDSYGITTELSRALERKVWLKSGGYLVVDQAEALVAIDVNTGRYVGKKNLEDTILKTNLEAVNEIAYQLRLRNCGGIIILDLIDMEKEENKQRVYRALEEALKKDRARPTILKISELGLVEMTRKRTRDTMVRALCEACTHCEGKGFVKSKQTVGYEVMRELEREGLERDIGKILVQAHPDVIDVLAIEERDTIDQLERRYRKQIFLQAVPDYHPEQFEVAGDNPDKKAAGVGRAREREEEGRDSKRRRGRGGRDRDRGSQVGSQGGSQERNSGERNAPSGKIRTTITVPSVPAPVSAGIVPAPPGSRPPMMVGPGMDPDSALNGHVVMTPGAQIDEDDDFRFNRAPSIQASTPAPYRTPQEDGFETEEDRVAYLRAQAAQDAALSGAKAPGNGNRFGGRSGGGGGGGPTNGRFGGGGGRDAQGRGGRKRRGRSGGRDRNDRGGRSGGMNGRGLPRDPDSVGNRGPGPAGPAAVSFDRTASSGLPDPVGGSGSSGGSSDGDL